KLPLEQERTAIMCSCDAYALEVLHYLREERKLRVPEDVGLIGFDHIDVLKYVHPKLTTVEYHIEEMGRAAVTRLLQKLVGSRAGGEHKEVIIDFTMTEGESLYLDSVLGCSCCSPKRFENGFRKIVDSCFSTW